MFRLEPVIGHIILGIVPVFIVTKATSSYFPHYSKPHISLQRHKGPITSHYMQSRSQNSAYTLGRQISLVGLTVESLCIVSYRYINPL